MKFPIRRALPEDAPRISELFVEMTQTIHGRPYAQGYAPGSLDRYFAADGSHILVAEDENKIIAFLSVEEHREGDVAFVYLDDFSVTAGYRGRGVGTELLQQAEAHARKRGFPYLVLHVEAFNARALRLYERHGFLHDQQTGQRIRMTKPLNQDSI